MLRILECVLSTGILFQKFIKERFQLILGQAND